MEVDDVVHFSTGEPMAKVSRANGGLIGRDMRKARHRRLCPIEGRQTYGSANRATPR